MIALTGIAKTYRQGGAEIKALDGIDLTIKPGEFVAIMGPSGSGKSTLLNVLGALDRPDAGSYRLGTDEVGELDDDAASDLRNRRIGFVFQSFHLLPRLTVLQNVMQPLVYRGMPTAERERLATQALAKVGLAHRLGHRPNQLSGGQRQRVAVARALVGTPSILLADEPTGNLDSKTSAEIMALFDELHGQGQTVVVVTHEPEIAAHCKRTIRVSDGRIVEDSRHPEIAASAQRQASH